MTEYASVAEAKAQAAEYFGFAAGEDITVTLPDGSTETFNVPFPGMLDDDQQERWDALQFEVEQCDRYPDVVIADHKLTHTITDADGKVEAREEFVPGRTIQGRVKLPYRRTLPDGTVQREILPSFAVRQAIALWGEDGYARFKSGGGQSKLIGMLQTKMQQQFEERQKSDSKSAVGAGVPEAVPEAD